MTSRSQHTRVTAGIALAAAAALVLSACSDAASPGAASTGTQKPLPKTLVFSPLSGRLISRLGARPIR